MDHILNLVLYEKLFEYGRAKDRKGGLRTRLCA